MCIVTVMNHGLRNGGGVGDILRKPSKDVSTAHPASTGPALARAAAARVLPSGHGQAAQLGPSISVLAPFHPPP